MTDGKVIIELYEVEIRVVREAWRSFAKNAAGIGDAIPELMSSGSILNHFFNKVLPDITEDTNR